MQIKPVKGFEGRYRVTENGEVYNTRGHRLKTHLSRSGYEQITLHDGMRQRTTTVHRLVAEAFLPNPDNLPQVNHKDECKTNNTLRNLEWCSDDYNQHYGSRSANITRYATCQWGKPVEQLIGDVVIARYVSIGQAARVNSIKATRISRVCSGERKTYAGYGWRYAS